MSKVPSSRRARLSPAPSAKPPRAGASRTAFLRVFEVHKIICAGRYPNCTTLAKAIERTPKTIQRDISFMRDQLGLQIATITEPGSLIGEMSVLLGDDHSATVRATTPVEVRVIENAIAFLESTPLVALQVATLVCQRDLALAISWASVAAGST